MHDAKKHGYRSASARRIWIAEHLEDFWRPDRLAGSQIHIVDAGACGFDSETKPLFAERKRILCGVARRFDQPAPGVVALMRWQEIGPGAMHLAHICKCND